MDPRVQAREEGITWCVWLRGRGVWTSRGLRCRKGVRLGRTLGSHDNARRVGQLWDPSGGQGGGGPEGGHSLPCLCVLGGGRAGAHATTSHAAG